MAWAFLVTIYECCGFSLPSLTTNQGCHMIFDVTDTEL